MKADLVHTHASSSQAHIIEELGQQGNMCVTKRSADFRVRAGLFWRGVKARFGVLLSNPFDLERLCGSHWRA